MHISKYIDTDFEDVFLIENECFSDPWSRETLKEELKSERSVYFTVKEEQRTVGYGGIKTLAEEAEIMKIAVTKEKRRSGAGSALIKALLSAAEASGAKELFLEVRKSNLPAINLYEKYGFEAYGIRKNYYGGKEDAVLFRKKLQGEKQ